MVMKTITTDQAVRKFDEYSKLAHDGEKILVTLDGQPWVVLAPPGVSVGNRQAPKRLTWPDFNARLAPHYAEEVSGPTATDLLARDKEDRF
jgi:hypothetical protein